MNFIIVDNNISLNIYYQRRISFFIIPEICISRNNKNMILLCNIAKCFNYIVGSFLSYINCSFWKQNKLSAVCCKARNFFCIILRYQFLFLKIGIVSYIMK